MGTPGKELYHWHAFFMELFGIVPFLKSTVFVWKKTFLLLKRTVLFRERTVLYSPPPKNLYGIVLFSKIFYGTVLSKIFFMELFFTGFFMEYISMGDRLAPTRLEQSF